MKEEDPKDSELAKLSLERPFIAGGVRIEKSRCCKAPLKKTRGGVIFDICTNCGKIHMPIKFK